MNGPEPKRRQDGFALIEAVVALAIVGLTMAVFYKAVGSSYGMQARVGNLSASVELARSQLDGLGVVTPLQAGTSTGAYATGFNWALTVVPVGKAATDVADAQDAPGAPPAFWIVLRVADRRGRTVFQLETARAMGALP